MKTSKQTVKQAKQTVKTSEAKPASTRKREYDIRTKRINLAIPEGMKEPLKARAHSLCYSVQDYLIELARRELFGAGLAAGAAAVTPPSPTLPPAPTQQKESAPEEKGMGPLDQ